MTRLLLIATLLILVGCADVDKTWKPAAYEDRVIACRIIVVIAKTGRYPRTAFKCSDNLSLLFKQPEARRQGQ